MSYDRLNAFLALLPVLFGCVAIGVGGVALAQTVSYSLGASSDLLDADFYAGKLAPGSSTVEAPSGRMVLNLGVNNAGTQAVFWAINAGTFQQGLFKVDIGDPSSWVRLTEDIDFDFDKIAWSPDDTAVFFASRRFVLATLVEEPGPWVDNIRTGDATATHKPTDNWLIGGDSVGVTGNSEIDAVPILPDGSADGSRHSVILTNFGLVRPAGNGPVALPVVSHQGDAIAFMVDDTSGVPDVYDSYVLEDLESILAAPLLPSATLPGAYVSSLAPTSLADSRVVDIRAADSSNPAGTPCFSQDGSIVFYTEDYNNTFDLENFFSSMAAGDWDINLATRDGTGDFRFDLPGNQAFINPFPSGSRLTYVASVNTATDFHVYATTLVVQNDIDAQTDPLPENGTTAVIDGQTVNLPFTLSDSAVQVATDTAVSDSSGTTVELPTDQVINFPDGTTVKEITIYTPVDPVSEIQLPDPLTQIPVLRSFGPPGTQFEPPVTVTISYTDAEVASIEDESSMTPYLYNETTQQFEPLDAAFLSTVVVDTVANTLSFQTDHFSTYGIGSAPASTVPLRPSVSWALAVMVFVTALLALYRRTEVFPKDYR